MHEDDSTFGCLGFLQRIGRYGIVGPRRRPRPIRAGGGGGPPQGGRPYITFCTFAVDSVLAQAQTATLVWGGPSPLPRIARWRRWGPSSIGQPPIRLGGILVPLARPPPGVTDLGHRRLLLGLAMVEARGAAAPWRGLLAL